MLINSNLMTWWFNEFRLLILPQPLHEFIVLFLAFFWQFLTTILFPNFSINLFTCLTNVTKVSQILTVSSLMFVSCEYSFISSNRFIRKFCEYQITFLCACCCRYAHKLGRFLLMVLIKLSVRQQRPALLLLIRILFSSVAPYIFLGIFLSCFSVSAILDWSTKIIWLQMRVALAIRQMSRFRITRCPLEIGGSYCVDRHITVLRFLQGGKPAISHHIIFLVGVS